MNIETKVTLLTQEIRSKFNNIWAKIGLLTSLSTTDKTTIVAAVNEVKTSADAAAVINDSATNPTEVWSGSKVDSEITNAVDAVIDDAVSDVGSTYSSSKIDILVATVTKEITSTYTVLPEDDTLLCSGTFVITLLPVSLGLEVTIINIDTGLITVVGDSGELIKGAPELHIEAGDSYPMVGSTTSWYFK